MDATALAAFGSALRTAALATFPALLTIGATAYSVAAVKGRITRIQQDTGYNVEMDAMALLPLSAYPAAPQAKTLVELDGVAHRILAVAPAPSAAAWEIWLEQTN